MPVFFAIVVGVLAAIARSRRFRRHQARVTTASQLASMRPADAPRYVALPRGRRKGKRL